MISWRRCGGGRVVAAAVAMVVAVAVALERGDFSLVGGASPVTSGSRSDNSPIELALNFGGVAHAWTCMSPTFPKRMISFPDRVDTRTRMSPGTCRSLYCMRAGPRVSRAHPATTIAG
jgi:hypothetical protein